MNEKIHDIADKHVEISSRFKTEREREIEKNLRRVCKVSLILESGESDRVTVNVTIH